MTFLLLLLLFGTICPIKLPKIKRVFVDRLTGGETAAQMRDLIINRAPKFQIVVLTENQERADAFFAWSGRGPDLYRPVQVLRERQYARQFERFGRSKLRFRATTARAAATAREARAR